MTLRAATLSLQSMVRTRRIQLMVARNILLYTLLMDGNLPPVFFHMILYHLHIDAGTLSEIRRQSAKLASLSESLATWNNGPYTHCIRLVNTQTAEVLRKFWTTIPAMVT
jgi:hypothetical protein